MKTPLLPRAGALAKCSAITAAFAPLLLALFGILVSPQTAQATVIADVSAGELSGMTQVYDLPIPNTFNFNTGGVPYAVDNSGSIVAGSFTRVGYYFEVQRNAGHPLGAGSREWVWVSMDTFDPAANMLGVPNSLTGIVENGTLVSNLNVETNHPSITPGTGLNGIVEFWASNYNGNGGGANGSSNFFDWTDSGGSSSNGHGSMQIFNINTPGSEETLFGFNGFNQSGRMGIANENAPLAGNTDWTFGPNANTFTIKNLEVWVGTPPIPEPSRALLLLLGLVPLAMRRRR